MNRITVAVVGPGRSGKDTAAEFLGQLTSLRYVGSTSWIGLDYMAERLGVCSMTAWESRHAHRARWNANESRIEMHLESLCEQWVQVAGKRFRFAEAETLHTENSYKFTVDW